MQRHLNASENPHFQFFTYYLLFYFSISLPLPSVSESTYLTAAEKDAYLVMLLCYASPDKTSFFGETNEHLKTERLIVTKSWLSSLWFVKFVFLKPLNQLQQWRKKSQVT